MNYTKLGKKLIKRGIDADIAENVIKAYIGDLCIVIGDDTEGDVQGNTMVQIIDNNSAELLYDRCYPYPSDAEMDFCAIVNSKIFQIAS